MLVTDNLKRHVIKRGYFKSLSDLVNVLARSARTGHSRLCRRKGAGVSEAVSRAYLRSSVAVGSAGLPIRLKYFAITDGTHSCSSSSCMGFHLYITLVAS